MGSVLQIFFAFFAAIMAIVIALNVFNHHWDWWALILAILLLFFADWIRSKMSQNTKKSASNILDALFSADPLEFILSILTLPVILLKKIFHFIFDHAGN